MENTSIGERFRQIMDSKKLNYSSFAKEIGTSDTVIRHIISGRNKPSFEIINSIIQAYSNINLTWLMVGKGSIYYKSGEESNIINEPNIDYKPQKNDDMIEQLNTLRKMVDYLLQENTSLKNELNELRKGQSKAAM